QLSERHRTHLRRRVRAYGGRERGGCRARIGASHALPLLFTCGVSMSAPRTLFDKIWQAHAVSASSDGETLFYVDRNFVHEGSFLAFGLLDAERKKIWRRSGNIGFVDHFAPTAGREKGVDG